MEKCLIEMDKIKSPRRTAERCEEVAGTLKFIYSSVLHNFENINGVVCYHKAGYPYWTISK